MNGKMWETVKQQGRLRVFLVDQDTRDRRKYVTDLSVGHTVQTMAQKSLEMSYTG